jgi:hypothetical protein
MPKPWMELKEARGKKVKRMTVEFDPDYNCVMVEFTDGTAMSVDVLPAVSIRTQFQNVSTGNTKILRNYREKINVAGKF